MARKVKTKKNRHFTGLLFWICLILLSAPFVVLGWILFSSRMDTGAPVIGNRYDGDLDPAITRAQLEEVATAVKGVGGIEDSDVELATATLRVYADIADASNAEEATNKANELYSVVSTILNPEIYFSQTDDKKMYDMEIHVYNLAENREAENFVYVIETKTSSMPSPQAQLVSEPKNPELAEALRHDVRMRAGEKEAEDQGGIYIGDGSDQSMPGEDNEQA